MQKNITENTCRVCLTEQDILINIFDEAKDFQTKISDLLECCGDLKVDSCDNYPKIICGDCTHELLAAARFREKCKKTSAILSQFITTECTLEDGDLIEEPQKDDSGHGEEEDERYHDGDNCIVMDFVEDADEIKLEEEDVLICSDSFEQIEFLDQNEVVDPGEDIIEFDDGPEALDGNTSNVKLTSEEPSKHKSRIWGESITTSKGTSKKKSNLGKPLVINCNCDICGAGFTHSSNLRRHLIRHDPKDIYSCSICDYPFTILEKMVEHQEEHDKDDSVPESNSTTNRLEEDVELPIENLVSMNKSSTQEEFNPRARDFNDSKATVKRNHKCSDCNKGFVSKSALSAHMRIHTGDRPYRCEECGKAFTTQGGLVLHTRRHTGHRPFTCNICQKSFVESSNLKVHMRIHTGEKPHKCTMCGRSFARVFLLEIHQRTHTGERPYQCPYCDKAFAQQGDLSSHKRIHTGERPHKCPFCPKGFIKSSALNQHLKKHWKWAERLQMEELSDKVLYPEKSQDNLRNIDILLMDSGETILSGDYELRE